MAFNHYAKLSRIISELSEGWYIRRIEESTRAKNFKGEVIEFSSYYRIYTASGMQVPYGKFQQIDRLARALNTTAEELPVVN